MVIRSLLTALGFDVDEQKIRRYNEGFKKAVNVTKMFAIAVGGLGAVFLKTAGDMEQTQIAFETMLGSVEEADALIKQITDFAAKTPFELTGLVNSSKQLLALGFATEEIIPTMTNLGNIAAGIGKDKLPTLVRSLGRMRTTGKVGLETLNMMLEAGVPILDRLSENLGVTNEQLFEMISAGTVTFDNVNDALTQMATGNGQFANLMEKQSRSFLGIMSNIGDFFQNLAIAIGTDLLPAAKEIAKAFLDFMEANKDMIKENVVGFFKTLALWVAIVFRFIQRAFKELQKIGVIDALIAAFETLFDILEGIFNFFGGLLKTLWDFKEVVAVIVTLFVAYQVAVNAIALATKLWAGFQAILNAAMMANPIGLIIAAIAALILAIVLIASNWDEFVQFLSETAGAVVDFLQGVWEGFANFFIGLWEGIVDTVTGLWDGLMSGINAAIDAVVGFLDGIAEFLGLKEEEQEPVYASEIAGVNDFPGAAANSMNVSVNSDITVGVPEGTPEEQKAAVQATARQAVREEWELINNEALSGANTGG